MATPSLATFDVLVIPHDASVGLYIVSWQYNLEAFRRRKSLKSDIEGSYGCFCLEVGRRRYECASPIR